MPDHITREEADRIAERAVERTLQRLSIDPQDWHEMQRDLQWVRASRQSMERMQQKARGGVVWGGATTFGAGIVYIVWYVLQIIHKGG